MTVHEIFTIYTPICPSFGTHIDVSDTLSAGNIYFQPRIRPFYIVSLIGKVLMKQSEEAWMIKNFPNLSNATCAIYLGKHPRTVVRMARKLGIVKSRDFIRSMNEASLKKASEVNSKRMKGHYHPNLQKWNNRNKSN